MACASGKPAQPGALSALCASSDGLKNIAARAAWRRKIIVTEWQIHIHRDAVLLAPRDHRMFDGALLQMIERLITGDLAFAGEGAQTTR